MYFERICNIYYHFLTLTLKNEIQFGPKKWHITSITEWTKFFHNIKLYKVR